MLVFWPYSLTWSQVEALNCCHVGILGPLPSTVKLNISSQLMYNTKQHQWHASYLWTLYSTLFYIYSPYPWKKGRSTSSAEIREVILDLTTRQFAVTRWQAINNLLLIVVFCRKISWLCEMVFEVTFNTFNRACSIKKNVLLRNLHVSLKNITPQTNKRVTFDELFLYWTSATFPLTQSQNKHYCMKMGDFPHGLPYLSFDSEHGSSEIVRLKYIKRIQCVRNVKVLKDCAVGQA